MDKSYWTNFREYLKMLAPGTMFREGLENVLQARTGALIVLGDSEELMSIVSGGFHINADFTPARLYELAKMDGAIITSKDASRIIVANAQLDPDPRFSSQETGIRHRTAQRVAQQTEELVISISQRRSVVTLYLGSQVFRMHDIPSILIKANQALQTLENYRAVLLKELQRLGGLEFEDMVTVGEVCKVLRRSLKVLGLKADIEYYIDELGSEGSLVKMQLDELVTQVEEEALLIIKDYSQSRDRAPAEIYAGIRRASDDDLPDSSFIAKSLELGGSSQMDQLVSSRGYRMFSKIPRIPPGVIDNLVEHFQLLNNVRKASIQELDDVEGIGEIRARSIKSGLQKMHEQLLIEYMV